MLRVLREGRGLFAQLLMALALISVGVQAGIPKGYMFDRDAQTGMVSVVFCTGYGPATRLMDMATGELREGDGQTDGSASNQVCAFAMASMAMPLPDIEGFGAPGRLHDVPLPAPARHAAASARQITPPARAPPRSA